MIESKDGTADTIMQSKREHRPFTYPLWPTSKPGPGATLPPPGHKPLSMRTDQMAAPACYDRGCRLAHTAGHLQLDQAVQLNSVLHWEFLGDWLDETVHNQRVGF
jgi:hypothetical protein